MEGEIRQVHSGCADGEYRVKARGCICVSLQWANEQGALPDWTPLAYFPVGANGVGSCRMTGGRAIPPEATHVLMQAVSADMHSCQQVLVPIPMPAVPAERTPEQKFLVLSDLHLSNQDWLLCRALSLGADWDGVLIPGDMTNDGTPEQLEHFWQCVTETLPHTNVFCVAGNHDYPRFPLPHIPWGIGDYMSLQEKLLTRAERRGAACEVDVSGAYSAVVGDTEILGLNGVTHWRSFRFPEGAQLEWLSRRLSASRAKHQILMCHAPLVRHKPYRQDGDAPYLHLNKRLQEIVDSRQNILFLSGHTHVSLNCSMGCVERDGNGNLYINAGSIHPTALKPDEPLQPSSWTEGNVLRLELGPGGITVTGLSLRTGKKISRGYYRFP